MSNYQPSEIDKLLAAELYKPLPKDRLLFTYFMNAVAFTFSVLALIPLISILWEIIVRGISGLSTEMFVKTVIDNGFANAILGTITVVIVGCVFSLPIGLFTGIFLAEFGKTNAIARFVRFITSIMTGVPSIVVGIFAYGVIVLWTKKFSAIAGGFALATIMLPIIVLTTEEALKLIPIDQRLASAALGGTRLQTTFRVIVKAALPAITTGVLLAVARAAGETAPLIFTALFSLDWSPGLFSPTASLPVLIFNLYNDPDPERNRLVWTTSIVLLGLVLCVSVISRLVTRKKKIN
ncbi:MULTISPECIES: phosphate ABC transporter permease PstA [unclassified Anabaena]|uniref:phosphate ABC transporter permease PstA n=1 Tax=unclassified Anabaena TaxID=2619674 RepID=UPI00082DB1B6|nr:MULTISPECIES: phosphate ABC transporter permease PstA [unclassified Anabaena]